MESTKVILITVMMVGNTVLSLHTLIGSFAFAGWALVQKGIETQPLLNIYGFPVLFAIIALINGILDIRQNFLDVKRTTMLFALAALSFVLFLIATEILDAQLIKQQ